MNEPIRLRGHHLQSFAFYISFEEEKRKYLIKESENLSYGNNFLENKRKIFFRIYNNPNQRVEIVANELDVLCLGECQRRRDSCVGNRDYDRSIANDFGLEVGKIYLSKEIIEGIKS